MTVLMWVIVPHEYFHGDHHDDQCTEADTHMHQTHKKCDACDFHFSTFSVASPAEESSLWYDATRVINPGISSPETNHTLYQFLRGPPVNLFI